MVGKEWMEVVTTGVVIAVKEFENVLRTGLVEEVAGNTVDVVDVSLVVEAVGVLGCKAEIACAPLVTSVEVCWCCCGITQEITCWLTGSIF